MSKKLLILATAITLLLCLYAGGASADGIVQTENGFRYVINADGTAAIVGYDYSAFTTNASATDYYTIKRYWNLYDIILPAEIAGATVTSAVFEPVYLASLYIPESIIEVTVTTPDTL